MRAWRIKHHPNTGDVRWLSYLMATTFHETAYTMLPIKEYGSTSYLQNKPYWPYIGRGYVMLTWDYNYEKGAALTGEDLLNFPDLAMNPELSAQITYDGMIRGWFTGKAFDDYFNATKDDPVNARQIVNGNDKDDLIAGYHKAFLDAIKASIAPIP
jgi:predicted chitinase